MITDKQQIDILKAIQVVKSIHTLLNAYRDLKDLSPDTEGGRRYECLLEVKLMAEEYRSKQIIEAMKK